MEDFEYFVIEVRDKTNGEKFYVGGVEKKEGVFDLVRFKTLSETSDFPFPSEEIATYITSVRFLEADGFETTVLPVGLTYHKQIEFNKEDFNCCVIRIRDRANGNIFYAGLAVNEVSEEDATVRFEIEHFFELSEAAAHPFFSEEAANEAMSGFLSKILRDCEYTLVPIRFRVDSGHPFAGRRGITAE